MGKRIYAIHNAFNLISFLKKKRPRKEKQGDSEAFLNDYESDALKISSHHFPPQKLLYMIKIFV